MKIRIVNHSRKNERGVTVLIVGLTLAAVIAMAALAIDVATLYQYRGEAQQAADAAALAGAKMFVTSGYTSLPAMDPTTICVNASGPGNTAAVDQQAELAAGANLIAGQAATIKSIQCNITANRLNPRVTVSVTRNNVPTFFAKIFNVASNIVTATATAEAYNPSGQSRPITVSGVKPWLVPNCDPTNSAPPINVNCNGSGSPYSYFIDPSNGSIGNGSFIGRTFCFSRVGRPSGPTAVQYSTSPLPSSDPNADCSFPVIRFYGVDIPIDYTKSSCPSSGSGCGQVGTNDFISNIACSSNYVFSCTQHISPSEIAAQVSPAGTYGTGSRDGGRCLIHANDEGLDNGQDVFVPTGPGLPTRIDGGTSNPNTSLRVENISRSSSIVTVPLYDGDPLCTSSGTCSGYDKIPQGFLQLGITQTMDLPNHFQAVILNVSGCNPNASGSPISVQDGSPIAVRLVQAP